MILTEQNNNKVIGDITPDGYEVLDTWLDQDREVEEWAYYLENTIPKDYPGKNKIV